MMFSELATVYYQKLFDNVFKAVRHTDRVTPFEFPITDGYARQVKMAIPLAAAYNHADKLSDITTNVVTADIQDVADYLILDRKPQMYESTIVSSDLVKMVRKLAHRAAGAYSALTCLAVNQHGRDCGAAARTKLFITVSNGPSVADPMELTPGWISYRMSFIAIPHEKMALIKGEK